MDGMDELRSPSLPTSPAAPIIVFLLSSMLSVLQLLGTIRCPEKPRAAHRNGTVNLFVAVDAHRSWRKVSVTERRTAQDYAERLRELVDVDDPDAACIRVVQDNLSTHTPG